MYPASAGRPATPGLPARLFVLPVFLGLVLGVALAVGRELMDRSVHDARALQSEFEVPVLGEIPRDSRRCVSHQSAREVFFMSRIQDILSKAERDGTTRRTRGVVRRRGDVAARRDRVAAPREGSPRAADCRPRADGYRRWHRRQLSGPNNRSPACSIRTSSRRSRPQSLAAEQYRSLRTRLKRAENGRAVRAIVVTSPNKGDGKSLTAANLALTMAQEFQQRVLLVEADLRRPSVHRLFGIPEAPGLTDVLMGAAELDQALVALPDIT